MDDIRLKETAFQLFGRAVARSDPSRLEAWVGLGLTITQLRVLFMLREAPGLSGGAIADRLSVGPSTVTRIVDRLVRLHLVNRKEDGDDRRLLRHCLSEAGLNAVEELERTGKARMDKVFGRLSREQLERLVTALGDLSEAATAVEAEESRRLEV